MFQYSASEQDVMKTRLETERYGLDITDDERPNSNITSMSQSQPNQE